MYNEKLVTPLKSEVQMQPVQLKVAKKEFQYNLEALRGVAALIVVWSHSFVFPRYLDPNYLVTGILSFEPPARISVFLFFVLSGYVIGISNKQALTKDTIGKYVQKRFLRIYPIYLIAILFTLLVAKAYPLSTVLGNLTLTQILLTPVIWENNPSWSLHYEILYYLLFIPISYFNIKPVLAGVIALTVGVVNNLLFHEHPLLTSYSFGFTLWLAGLALARYSKDFSLVKTKHQVLIGFVFVFISLRNFNVLDTIFLKAIRFVAGNKLEYGPIRGYDAMVNFSDFSYLPYFILFLLVFANKNFAYKKYIQAFLLLMPGLTFVYIFKNFHSIKVNEYIMPSVAYVIGLSLIYSKMEVLEKVATFLIKSLIKVGALSYGFYIIHLPIIVLLHKIDYFSGSAFTFGVRFITCIILALTAAYVLEKKVQPKIVLLFTRPSFGGASV